ELKKLLSGKDFSFFAGKQRAFSLEGRLFSCPDPLGIVTDPELNKRMAVYDLKQLCHLCAAENRPAPDAAFDAMLAAYLVNPSDSISIASLLWIYAQTSADEAQLSDADFMLSRLDKLRKTLTESLTAFGMDELYRTVEIPLARTLAGMEQVGFAVDRAGLEAYGAELKKDISVLEKDIKRLCGVDFNVNSPKQLGKVLFEDLGLPAPKKTKSGYTTDAQTLEKLADCHPAIPLILDYRALTKLNGTYAEGLVKAIDPSDGRIHTRFNQTQTATGRLSSLEPNLQNIPVRTPLGRELRRFFVAKEGCVLVDADYSQIELRLLAHLSGDEALIRAFADGEDIHRRTASRVFGVPFESVTPEMRKAAKAINFGIIYGMGAFSLAQDIKVPRAEAARYIEEYFASYPKVKGYLESLIEDAKANGFVTTMFGRRRYVPELSAARKNLAAFGERVARNTPIQGTAADIIKLAMVRVDRRLREEKMQTRLILQIHDELILEAPLSESERAAALLSEEMENAVKLKVRLVSDARVGKTWYDCH
ncbi:MAG: DNA polymerase I, partial [Clostridia bacterium]|nr:DNA polymerase I [Clostridia bacterium]